MKIGKAFSAMIATLFLLAAALFAVGCDLVVFRDDASYGVSLDVNDDSLGACTLSAANDGELYRAGTPVTVSVEPKEDYDAVVLVNGKEVSLSDCKYTFDVEGETSIIVYYSYKYTVHAYIMKGRGVVIFSDPADGFRYTEGEEVEVLFLPEDGYAVQSVKQNAQPIRLERNRYTFRMEGHNYFGVQFAEAASVTVENDETRGKVTLDGWEEGEFLFADGSETELAVTPTEGNEVASVCLNGKEVALRDGRATVRIEKNTTISVYYNVRHTVSLPDPDTLAGGRVSLDKSPDADGMYREGTRLVLSLLPDEGYRAYSVRLNGTDVPFSSDKCTFFVKEDTVIEVVFLPISEIDRYTVTVVCSDDAYGSYTLSEPPLDGTYGSGTRLTLTAIPAEGYELRYLLLNGEKVDLGENELSYTFTVDSDAVFYLNFAPMSRFIVRLERYGLAEAGVSARLQESIYGSLREEEDYAEAYYYDGQDVSIFVDDTALAGGAVFYSLNGSRRKLLLSDKITVKAEITRNVVSVFVGEPTKPDVRFSLGEGESDGKDLYTLSYSKGFYTVTLKDGPAREGFRFTGWSVTLNGISVTSDGQNTFSVPYQEGGMRVRVTAEWEETVRLQIVGSEHGGISLAEGGEGIYDKDVSVSLLVQPDEGYRVKEIVLSFGDGEHVVTRPNTLGPVSLQATLTRDLAVSAVFQQIFTVAFTVKNGTGSFCEAIFPDGTFCLYDSGTNRYTLDAGDITFSLPSLGRPISSVSVGGELLLPDGRGNYSFYLDGDSLVEIALLSSFTVRVNGSDRTDGTLDHGKFSMRCVPEEGQLQAERAEFYTGTDVVLTFTADDGCMLEALNDGTAERDVIGKTRYELLLEDLSSDHAVTVTFSLLPVLGETFPAEGRENGAPVQGAWKNTDEGDGHTLVIGEHGIAVNGDLVGELIKSGTGGASEYGLTTLHGRRYSLSWFAEKEGYILYLTEKLAAYAISPQPIGEGYAYFINPLLKESELQTAASDELEGTWVGEDTVTLADDGENLTLAYGGRGAKYIIPADGSYLAVMEGGETVHVFSKVGELLLFDGGEYVKKEILGFGKASLFHDGALGITLTVLLRGYSEEEMRSCFSLLVGGNVYAAEARLADETATLSFRIDDMDDGSYPLQLLSDGELLSACPCSEAGEELVLGDITYTLSVGDELLLNKRTLRYFSVHILESGKTDGCAYVLSSGGERISDGGKVAENAELILSLTLPEGFTAEVKGSGCTLSEADGKYILSELTGDVTLTVVYIPPVGELTAAGADLVWDGERVSFVVFGTYRYFSDGDLRTELLSRTLVLRPTDPLGERRLFASPAITAEGGNWTLSYDISSLEIGTYVAEFEGFSDSGDIVTEHAENGKEAALDGRTFRLVNPFAEDGGCVGVTVTESHVYLDGVCRDCGAVCGHERSESGVCTQCGAILEEHIFGDAESMASGFDLPAETALKKGNTLLIFGTQRADTAEGAVAWEITEGFTGTLLGGEKRTNSAFKNAVSNRQTTLVDRNGETLSGVDGSDLCGDCKWLLRFDAVNDRILSFSASVTSLSGEYVGCTYTRSYLIETTKTISAYHFRLTGGEGLASFTFSGSKMQTLKGETVEEIPLSEELRDRLLIKGGKVRLSATVTAADEVSGVVARVDLGGGNALLFRPDGVAALIDGTESRIGGESTLSIGGIDYSVVPTQNMGNLGDSAVTNGRETLEFQLGTDTFLTATYTVELEGVKVYEYTVTVNPFAAACYTLGFACRGGTCSDATLIRSSEI